MRFLFVHQSFPGQYLHLLRKLHQEGGHDIVFITATAAGPEMPGVRRVLYSAPTESAKHLYGPLQDVSQGFRRAERVAARAKSLKELGFQPDIIIGHHGWGELLNLKDVYPDTPILGYFEFFYRPEGLDVGFDPEFPSVPSIAAFIRVKNTLNFQGLALAEYGQTPTKFQRNTYPDWARGQIRLLGEGVDLSLARPDPLIKSETFKLGGFEVRPEERLVTFAARDLEPYRGFHSFMRALPQILWAREDVKVIILGADGSSYGPAPAEGGTWKEKMLLEVGRRIDPERVYFAGRAPYGDFLRLLRRSDAHVYLTYPFVLSWSLREAMASGCPIIGSDTPPVQEFIQHGQTGMLAPFLRPSAIAEQVLEVLESRPLRQFLGENARTWAEEHLDINKTLARQMEYVSHVVEDSRNRR